MSRLAHSQAHQQGGTPGTGSCKEREPSKGVTNLWSEVVSQSQGRSAKDKPGHEPVEIPVQDAQE